MREILFRGKCNEIGKYNGQWIEGFYAVDDGKPLIAHSTNNGLNGYFCEPGSIGEYTGMQDKNNRKIFEGDIVVINTSEKRKIKKYRVEFDNGIFGIRFPAHAYNNTIIPLRSFDYIEIIKGEEND